MGLTLAKLVMEYHGGAIDIGNRTDCAGSFVVLSIPMAADDVAPVEGNVVSQNYGEAHKEFNTASTL